VDKSCLERINEHSATFKMNKLSMMPTCCSASETLNVSVCFQLGTCDHRICIKCFSNANAKRLCNPYIECPCCNSCSNAWKIISWKMEKRAIERRERRLRSNTNEVDDEVEMILVEKELGADVIPEPTLEKDPKQYHKTLDVETMKKVAILSFTSEHEDEAGQSKLGLSATVMDWEKDPEEWDKTHIDNLVIIFQFLHTLLVKKDDAGRDNIESYLTPSKGHCNLENSGQQCSVLHRCIHALALGSLIGNEANMTSNFRNLRAGSFAATDIIRTMKSKRVGRLKKLVARQLIANGASQGLWKILTKFGIAPGIETERLRTITEVHSEIIKGLPNTDPHDLWALLYDNIGFRIRAGYEQYTAMQWVRMPKEELQSWGIYPKEGETMEDCPFEEGHALAGKTYTQLRERKDWETIRGESNFEDVLGINTKDIERLADSTFGTIHQLLLVFDQLPTIKDAITLLKDAKETKWDHHYVAPDNRTADTLSNGGAVSAVVSYYSAFEENNGDIESRPVYDSNYEASNAFIDRPMKRDLNSKSTCKVLLDYAVQMRGSTIAKEAEGCWKDIPKVMEEFPLPLCGDGNPTFIISTLMRDERAKYSKKVAGFSGGFHMMLEAHRKRGAAFGQTHLEDFFSCWRPTDGQLRWVMNPGDPNQINAELTMYVLGMYSAAILSALKMKAAAGDTEDIILSAKEVADLMVARAKEYPIVMITLIELRFAELTFMLLESEQNGGNVDLYLTAKKLLGRLYAGTHCTKYVSMLADFFVEWHCCSDVEKIIFAEGIFTRKTKNGETIFSVS